MAIMTSKSLDYLPGAGRSLLLTNVPFFLSLTHTHRHTHVDFFQNRGLFTRQLTRQGFVAFEPFVYTRTMPGAPESANFGNQAPV